MCTWVIRLGQHSSRICANCVVRASFKHFRKTGPRMSYTLPEFLAPESIGPLLYRCVSGIKSRPYRAWQILITRELKRHENVDRLFPPNHSGWYQYLFNQLLDNGDAMGFSKSQLNVVTFNYDRSLEAYLHEALMARFKMTDVDDRSSCRKLKSSMSTGQLVITPMFRTVPRRTPLD